MCASSFGAAGFLVHTVAEKPDPLTPVFNQKVLPDFTFDSAPRADVLLRGSQREWSIDVKMRRIYEG
jgi:hypothetical protein